MSMSNRCLIGLALVAVCGVAAELRAGESFLLRDVTVVVEDDFIPDPAVRRDARWKNPKRWGLAAAADLTNAIFRIAGAKAPVVKECDFDGKAKAVVFLGATRAAKAAGLDVGGLKFHQAEVKVLDRTAFVAARTGIGTSFGVTEFLERCVGHYQIAVYRDFDVYDRDPSRRVARQSFRTERAIPVVDSFLFLVLKYGDELPVYQDWQRRLAMGTEIVREEVDGPDRLSRQVEGCHTFYYYCSPKVYFKDHPEYFSMNRKGKRHAEWNGGGQLCLTNPDVQRIVTSNLLAFIERDRKANPTNYPCIYDFSQLDLSNDLCWCPSCSNLIERYTRKPGSNFDGGDMGLQLHFVNPIAREVAKRYPDVKIRIFSYVSTQGMPKEGTIVPERNVMIRRCDGYAFSCHYLPLEHPYNDGPRKALEDYCRYAAEVELWDYMLYGGEWSGVYPEVSVDAIVADAKFFRKIGLRRMYMELDVNLQATFELHAFLLGQYYRNPDADLGRLLDVYCRLYGRGAPKMREAIDFLRKIEAEGRISHWHHRQLSWRTLGNMRRLHALMKEAYAAERPGTARARIAAFLTETERELARLLRSEPRARKELKEVVAALTRHTEEKLLTPGGVSLRPANARKELERQMESIRSLYLPCADLPKGLSGVPEDDIVCLGNDPTTVPGGVRWRVDDPKSPTGKAFRFKKTDYPKMTPPYGFPVNHPVYLRKLHGPFKVEAKDIVRDGRYHWHYLGGGEALAGLTISSPAVPALVNWGLSRAYVSEPARFEKNPNVWDYYVSLREDDEALYVDRLLAVRKWD